MQLFALLRLAFAAPTSIDLSLLHRLTRWPIIQKVRRHQLWLRLLVSIQFQVFFTPLIGVLFTFPSRYLFTIGQIGVLRLGGWSPHVQTEFLVFRLTRRSLCFLLVQDYHLLWSHFPESSNYYIMTIGLVRVRSPLLTESRLISFPLGTEMFHFPRFASSTYVFSWGYSNEWVSPFGHSWIKVCSQLPMTYRSVPRPSSPLFAKASTKCSLYAWTFWTLTYHVDSS